MQLAKQYPMVSIHHLDVTIPEDIKAIVWEMEGKPIDILINNAGIYLEKGTPEFGCLRYYEWARTLAVNTLGGMRVAEALVDNVAASDKRLIGLRYGCRVSDSVCFVRIFLHAHTERRILLS